MHAVTVRTGPNIAVIKYWGKRDAGPLNLACNASVSLTMDNTDICSQTTVATTAARKHTSSTSGMQNSIKTSAL